MFDLNGMAEFLQGLTIWPLVVLIFTKLALGIIVAVQKSEFKWFYVGNILKEDVLKLAAVAVVVYTLDNTALSAGLIALLVADTSAGITKNVAHIFPTFADKIPSSFREPSRMRLGNPKNLPN